MPRDLAKRPGSSLEPLAIHEYLIDWIALTVIDFVLDARQAKVFGFSNAAPNQAI